MKKLVKFVHEIGAVGVMGALAACIVLLATAAPPPLPPAGDGAADGAAAALPAAVPAGLAGYAAVRHGVAQITQWILVPSLAVVTITGLLAIAINRAYTNAGWAWLKALMGVSLFEGSLLTIAGSARQADELMTMAVAGQADPAALAEILRTEWGGLWLIMGVSVANIALAVWRPRIGPRPLRDADEPPARIADPPGGAVDGAGHAPAEVRANATVDAPANALVNAAADAAVDAAADAAADASIVAHAGRRAGPQARSPADAALRAADSSVAGPARPVADSSVAG